MDEQQARTAHRDQEADEAEVAEAQAEAGSVDNASDRGQNERLSSAVRFALTAVDEARIRAAAQDALSRAFEVLVQEHVLPRSRYRPWIHMARDYFGHAVEGSEGPLSKALEAALPERFAKQHGRAIDYPWNYTAALLEAADAAATLAGESYNIASPAVRSTIDALIEKVQATPRATVLQVVADVDVEHPPLPAGYQDRLGEALDIGGVRVIRVANHAERFIERELPSAGYEVERSAVFTYPGPVSLLVATAEVTADYETGVDQARQRVDNLIAAIRLATGGTAYAVVDVYGDPDRVRWLGPSITPLPSWGFRFVHRPITLSTRDVPGLVNLASLIKSWRDTGNGGAVLIAIGRLARSLDGRAPSTADQVVDLAVGLEATLAGADKTEVGLRLRSRAADILATDVDPPEAIYRDVRTLYDLRSTVVHGGSLSEKEVKKAIMRVTGVARARWPAEQYLLALDRWRDLLRRAILARIALVTAPVKWPAQATGGRQLDVDEFLLQETNRNAWRQHIRAFWRDQGLPDAPNLPTEARMAIGATSETETSAGSPVPSAETESE